MVINYYAKKLGIAASYVAIPNWCAARPDWLVIENPNNSILAFKQPTVILPRCKLQFSQVGTYPSWGLSGLKWVLYRLVN